MKLTFRKNMKEKMGKTMLSKHFSLKEMTKTKTGMTNVPDEVQVRNLKRLCRWLEMLRDEWNRRYGDGDGEDPIIINSAFRSEKVNKAVGGSPTSNHLTGCAVDIRVYGVEQLLRYAVILLDISDESREKFDELLLEKRGGTYWLHFAVRAGENRRRVSLTP